LRTGAGVFPAPPPPPRLRAEGLTVTTLDVSGPADITADVTDEVALREVAGRIGPVDVLVN
jgi:hypothetical protein